MSTQTIDGKVYHNLQELFADENRWCRGSLARDKDGNQIGEHAKLAVSFCLAGAIYRFKLSFTEDIGLIELISAEICITQFNDSPFTTIEDIRALVAKYNL